MKRTLTIILALSFGMVAFGEDSPMVAAAKRANRKGKKPTNVITNETLAKSGGNAHVTTTAKQAPFVAPKPYVAPSPTPEMVALKARDAEKRRAAAEASAQAKASERHQARSEAAAAAAEEGLYDDVDVDPAQAEKTQQDTSQKPPQR
ncbi:MAG TPA: hypothetical protein VNI54_11910 [Thermoanaerobaculia bacterium]|nr:hypothetical protein [Thermoanaerobaculia bacterium]